MTGMLVIDGSIIGYGVSSSGYNMPDDSSNGKIGAALMLQDNNHTAVLKTAGGMNWWSNTGKWEESCTVVVHHDFDIVDTATNWNASVAVGYESNTFEVRMVEQNYNDPTNDNLKITIDGTYGGSLEHWWMKITEAELFIGDEDQGSLEGGMEYASPSSDVQWKMLMSLKAMDVNDVVKFHAENSMTWPSGEMSMYSLMQWVDVMNWDLSTTFYTKDNVFGMTFTEKNYNADDESYNMMATMQMIYHGEDSTRWHMEVVDTKLGFDNSLVGNVEAALYFTDAAAHPSEGILRSYFAIFNGDSEPQFLTDQAWLWYGGEDFDNDGDSEHDHSIEMWSRVKWVHVMNWNITGEIDYDSDNYAVSFTENPYDHPERNDFVFGFGGSYSNKNNHTVFSVDDSKLIVGDSKMGSMVMSINYDDHATGALVIDTILLNGNDNKVFEASETLAWTPNELTATTYLWTKKWDWDNTATVTFADNVFTVMIAEKPDDFMNSVLGFRGNGTYGNLDNQWFMSLTQSEAVVDKSVIGHMQGFAQYIDMSNNSDAAFTLTMGAMASDNNGKSMMNATQSLTMSTSRDDGMKENVTIGFGGSYEFPDDVKSTAMMGLTMMDGTFYITGTSEMTDGSSNDDVSNTIPDTIMVGTSGYFSGTSSSDWYLSIDDLILTYNNETKGRVTLFAGVYANDPNNLAKQFFGEYKFHLFEGLTKELLGNEGMIVWGIDNGNEIAGLSISWDMFIKNMIAWKTGFSLEIMDNMFSIGIVEYSASKHLLLNTMEETFYGSDSWEDLNHDDDYGHHEHVRKLQRFHIAGDLLYDFPAWNNMYIQPHQIVIDINDQLIFLGDAYLSTHLSSTGDAGVLNVHVVNYKSRDAAWAFTDSNHYNIFPKDDSHYYFMNTFVWNVQDLSKDFLLAGMHQWSVDETDALNVAAELGLNFTANIAKLAVDEAINGKQGLISMMQMEYDSSTGMLMDMSGSMYYPKVMNFGMNMGFAGLFTETMDYPTISPSPTRSPTHAPTKAPTTGVAKTNSPTRRPTQLPTMLPTLAPAITPYPTVAPTKGKKVEFSATQTFSGIDYSSFVTNREANELALKKTIAQCMTGVTADEITDLVVSDGSTSRRLDASLRSIAIHLHLTSTLKVSYTVVLASSALTYDQLVTQLNTKISSGEFTAILSDVSADVGGNLSGITASPVEAEKLSSDDDDSGKKDDTAVIIIAVVVSVVGVALIALIIYCIVNRRSSGGSTPPTKVVPTQSDPYNHQVVATQHQEQRF